MATKRSKTEEQPNVGAGHELDVTAIQLKRRREELGLSIVDLHKATGIARTALHDYEAGRYKPGLTEIRKLCAALRVTPNRLVVGRDDLERQPTALEETFGVGPQDVRLVKLVRLTSMLPPDEQEAVMTLVLGLVTSRYAKARVTEEMSAVDLAMGITNLMTKATKEGVADKVTPEYAAKAIGEVAPDLVSEERAKQAAERKPRKPAK